MESIAGGAFDEVAQHTDAATSHGEAPGVSAMDIDCAVQELRVGIGLAEVRIGDEEELAAEEAVAKE